MNWDLIFTLIAGGIFLVVFLLLCAMAIIAMDSIDGGGPIDPSDGIEGDWVSISNTILISTFVMVLVAFVALCIWLDSYDRD